MNDFEEKLEASIDRLRKKSHHWHDIIKGCEVIELADSHHPENPLKFCVNHQIYLCRHNGCFWRIYFHLDHYSLSMVPARYRTSKYL